MKDVGYTQEGNRLVEMNQAEYAQFSRLRMAVEGKSPGGDFYTPRDFAFMEGYDFSETFEVIRAFFEANFQINTLQNLVWGIRASINKTVVEKKEDENDG